MVTCGNSAGGYMAVIVGNRINANCIFSFGGQWDIYINPESMRNALIINKYSGNILYNQYFDITRFTSEKVFWFFSVYAEQDKEQMAALKKKDNNLCIFAINTEVHGDLLFFQCYEKILTLDFDKLQNLYYKYRGKIINKRKFCLEFLQFNQCIPIWWRDIVNHHKSLKVIFELCERGYNLMGY